MIINNVEIEETYAEGFSLYGSRILITASTLELAKIAAEKATGFATSTIHCDSESGIDSVVPADRTPDGRPGISVMLCVSNKKKMDEVLLNRIGQCVLTAPTTSCFDWFPSDVVSEKTFEVKTGFKLKFFGDGFEEKDKIMWNGAEINVWKIPTMDGNFIVQSSFKVTKIAGGGNFMVFGEDPINTVEACKKAVEKMMEVDGIVMPFPMGVVRSPSKVGSKYDFLTASTNHPLSPVLKGKTSDSVVPDGAKVGYEFILNGFDKKRVDEAMKVGIMELTQQPGIIKITAGNFGGKLGKIFYNLKEILS
ncbi:MAG: formylmethanofuran--tetrahydromethanopterin N-formyltransferase [archaeon]|nr:formylmethanofuran--tetrahydromethanopterin N-formyltransferase [archaeon]